MSHMLTGVEIIEIKVRLGSREVELPLTLENTDFLEESSVLDISNVKKKIKDAGRQENLEIQDAFLVNIPKDLIGLKQYEIIMNIVQRISITNAYKNAADDYKKVAGKIRRNTFTDQFIKVTKDIREIASNQIFNLVGKEIDPDEINPNIPYIACIASAGSGKTQFSFLVKMLRPNSCVRLVLDEDLRPRKNVDDASNPQNINMNLSSLSLSFNKLYTTDWSALNDLENIKSCKFFYLPDIFTKKLSSIGFVVALLAFVAKADYAKELYNSRRLPSIDDLDYFLYKPMSVKEALSELKKFKISIPIVFLDEFNASNNSVLFAFARNIFRALGVVCVTMGTDSAASNLIHPAQISKNSSQSAKRITWVYVWHELPPPQLNAFLISKKIIESLETLKKYEHFVDLVSWIEFVPCSNPRMFKFFLNAVESIVTEKENAKQLRKCSVSSLLNQIIEKSGENLRITKPFDTEEALIGQIAVNFKTWRDIEIKDSKIQKARASFLIHRHYANLCTNSKEPYIVLERERNSLKLEGVNKTSWKPTSTFPSYTGNELFYLSLLNYRYDEYFLNDTIQTAADAFRIYFNRIVVKSTINLNEANARSHDGFAHEHFCHLVFMISSRFSNLENPYMGQGIGNFILNLVKNFDTANDNPKIEDYTLEGGFCSDFGKHRIPYLVPMGAESSEAFKKLQGLIGDLDAVEDKKKTLFIRSLLYTFDSESIDGKVERRGGSKEGWFLIEIKNIEHLIRFAEILAMVKKAFRTTLKHNKDKDVPEFLIIFARNMEAIDDSESSCAEISNILRCKNVVFHQVYLIDWKVRILPRPVSDHNPDLPTLNVILFSLQAIYGEDYDTDFNQPSTQFTKRNYTEDELELIERKRNVPLRANIRSGNRINQGQRYPLQNEPGTDEVVSVINCQQVRHARRGRKPYSATSKRRRTN